MTANPAFPTQTVTLSMLEAAIPDGPWFFFDQNNSGGYFTPPARNVLIAADSMEEARERLEAQDGYTSAYCECCGGRWYADEINKVEMARRLMDWADPEHWENKDRGDGVPPLLVLPAYAPNKAVSDPLTLAGLMHSAVKLLAETGEAFEDPNL